MTENILTKNDTYTGNLILVNETFPLIQFPKVENMAAVRETQPAIFINEEAANLLQVLLSNIHCKNEIIAVSGFRTQEEQQEIWDNSYRENGADFTKKFVAMPGHSEHQTGLAIDLAANKENIDFICPEFPYTGIFQKFREKAPNYGFVERYTSPKESITGIGAEPWHFRYVGYPHSIIMTRKELALEEYIQFLKMNTDFHTPYVYHSSGTHIAIYYMALNSEKNVKIDVPETNPYMISGTNEGGVIVSIWRA